jgi:pimeloyl-ACP methyl ester carboxylesterase
MRFRLAWLVVALWLLQACAPFRAVQGPIPQVSDEQSCGVVARHLIVLLPGLRDVPADFIAEGFVQAVRSRQLDADIVLLDAHVGYYNERQIVHRLHDEVIVPARAKGHESIWLVGISLGGLGTLLYSEAHPQTISGFYVMAPYLGDKALVNEIGAAGLANWIPGKTQRLGSQGWRLAQSYLSGATGLPMGHIGYGDHDRFAQANAIWASALPQSHRYVVPGGHDWRTWKALWSQFLDSGVIDQTQRVNRPCGNALPS